MISDPPTFVLIGLGLALVAMFAVGFYWLATKSALNNSFCSATASCRR